MTDHHPPNSRRFRLSSIIASCVCLLALAFAYVVTASSPPPVHIADPLAPPDTASPQATLTSLQRSVSEGAGIISTAYEHHIHSPGLFESDATRQEVANARALLARAIRCLDLSAIAPANREKLGTERVLMLAEVLYRLPASVAPDGKNGSPLPDRWTVPNTEIRIARVPNGPRAGEYLFTAETVERLPAFYAAIRDRADAAHFDFYQFYSLSPGDLMPPKWYALVQKLPAWAMHDYADQAVWQWVGYALTLLLLLTLALVLYLVSRSHFAHRRMASSLRRLLTPFGILVGTALAGEMIRELNITGTPYEIAHTGLIAARYIAASWLVAAATLSLADWAANAAGLRPRSIDAGMMRLALRIVGIAAGAGVLAFGASELGVPLVGIVAGLGVGGLAIALAAQPTIENLIGGVMIYADRPVRVGDNCKFGDISGVVEEIGIRSTRIRASDRSLISIPNADFSKQRLVNVDRRDRMVVTAKIGLRYGTTQSQLRDILSHAAHFFEKHPLIDEKSSTLRLTDFGARALDLELNATLNTRDKNDLPPVREEILLAIAGIAEQAGTGLAQRVSLAAAS